MADRLAAGTLADHLKALRADGLSWDMVAMRLFADHGVEVSAETLRQWGDELAIPDPKAPTEAAS